MKTIATGFVMQFMLLISFNFYAQVGIGTATPNSSSLLDLQSDNKGFLMPRLTSDQRDLILDPATGLMIYNSTLNDGQLNMGTPNNPIWVGIKKSAESAVNSVSYGNTINTASTSSLLVSGMTIDPLAGTYLVLFNAQMFAPENEEFSSDQGAAAVNTIYTELMAATGGEAHDLVFGNDEVLPPGVYDVTGAASIAGILTLDGNNETNPLFIIRSTGALTTGADATVNLINGAEAKNIFWLSEGAMSTGDTTVMKGTLISNHNAVALGANTNLEGRIFSTTGALSMGAGTTLTSPTGLSSIDLGVLASFAMFTASGAISGCEACSVSGDVGTGLGAATYFSSIQGTVYPVGTTAIAAINSEVFYSIFKEGVKVEHSGRTVNLPNSLVSLQSVVSVLDGETIEIRWEVDGGEVLLNHRTLSLIRF